MLRPYSFINEASINAEVLRCVPSVLKFCLLEPSAIVSVKGRVNNGALFCDQKPLSSLLRREQSEIVPLFEIFFAA